MPLIKIEKINDKSSYAIWEITESLDQLSLIGNDEGIVPPEKDIHNEVKKMEWLAGRLALKRLIENEGEKYFGINKDSFGKPHLNELSGEISLSHSFPWVAAIYHYEHPVGVDFEEPKEKMLRIAPKFMSDDELKQAQHDLNKICVYWCAKEALYKLYGKKSIVFKEQLPIDSFQLSDKFELSGSIVVNNEVSRHKMIAIKSNGNYLVFTND